MTATLTKSAAKTAAIERLKSYQEACQSRFEQSADPRHTKGVKLCQYFIDQVDAEQMTADAANALFGSSKQPLSSSPADITSEVGKLPNSMLAGDLNADSGIYNQAIRAERKKRGIAAPEPHFGAAISAIKWLAADGGFVIGESAIERGARRAMENTTLKQEPTTMPTTKTQSAPSPRPGNVKWTGELDRAARMAAKAKFADLSAGDRIRAGGEQAFVTAEICKAIKGE